LKVKVSPGYFINLWTVLFQPGKTRTCKNFFPPVVISDGLLLLQQNFQNCCDLIMFFCCLLYRLKRK